MWTIAGCHLYNRVEFIGHWRAYSIFFADNYRVISLFKVLKGSSNHQMLLDVIKNYIFPKNKLKTTKKGRIR